MPVLDPGLPERCLQPERVGPGVLPAANATTLADVEDHRDAMAPQRAEEILWARVVDADGGDRPHGKVFSGYLTLTTVA